jgi:hypothetical protein
MSNGCTLTFVSSGSESASRGAETAQQFRRAGLPEEIHPPVAALVRGRGQCLFDHVDTPVELETTGSLEAPCVTHPYFRIVK